MLLTVNSLLNPLTSNNSICLYAVSFWSVFNIDHNHYSVIGVIVGTDLILCIQHDHRGLVTHYHVSGSQYVNVGLLEPIFGISIFLSPSFITSRKVEMFSMFRNFCCICLSESSTCNPTC